MDLLTVSVGIVVAAVFGSAIVFTWALCRSSAMADEHTALDYKRDLEVRYPPTLSGRAAKGFKRDQTIGVDQVTRAERGKWIA